MLVEIDPTSPVPPYEQVRAGIAARAHAGTLPAGTRLPTVRTLATDLHIAVNTAARAYRELEQAGIVETRGRNGTYITADAAGIPQAAEHLATTYATEIRRLGLTDDQALALVRAALR